MWNRRLFVNESAAAFTPHYPIVLIANLMIYDTWRADVGSGIALVLVKEGATLSTPANPRICIAYRDTLLCMPLTE